MEWFFVKKVFGILRNAENTWYTGVSRCMTGFSFLGLRLSPENLKRSSDRYDRKQDAI